MNHHTHVSCFVPETSAETKSGVTALPVEVLDREGGGHDAEAVYELVLHDALHQHRAQLRHLPRAARRKWVGEGRVESGK